MIRLLGVLLAALPASLAAQAGIAASADASTVRAVMGADAAAVTLTGATVGGAVLLVGPPMFLYARYAQGTLTGTGAPATTLVSGDAAAGIAPTSWLAVSAGPLVYAYANPAVERWVLWVARARLSAPLIGGLARSWVEGRRSFAAQVNVTGGAPEGTGLGVGLAFQAPVAPVGVALEYRADRLEIPGGARRTMECLSLSLRLGRQSP